MGKSGNNLNGIYIGNTLGIQHWQRPGRYWIETSDGRNYNPYLKGIYKYSTLNLGWQRRFGKHGFVHLQFGAGIRQNKEFDFPVELLPPSNATSFSQLPRWQPLMTYKVGVGIALGKTESAQVNKPILEYHKEDLSMWKLDLLPIFLGTGENTLLSKINIGYEQGIKNTSFSINTNLVYLLPNKQDYEYLDNYLGLQISPRLYYNFKKRKTVNHLSANYFSMRNEWNIVGNHSWGNQKYSFALLWGMQRRLFKHLFINYELGYEFGGLFSDYIISDLKIGLAF